MSHRIIILDKSKAFGGVLADIVAEVSRADGLEHHANLSNHTAIEAKIDVISDFLSDNASDLEGHLADLTALLPTE